MLTPLVLSGMLLTASEFDPATLPVVEVTSDNVRVTESCQLMVPRGTRINDADNNGVVHIMADGIVVTMADGSDAITGSGWAQAPDQRTGVGVRVEGFNDVTISGLRLRGFGAGVVASDTSGLVIEGCEIRDGYGAPLGKPAGGVDSSGRGVAITLRGAVSPTIKTTTVRGYETGLLADEAPSLQAFDNDFSYLSRAGIELVDSPDAVVGRNLLDGIYGGEGRPVTAIRVTGQSDRAQIAFNAARHLGPDGTGLVLGSEEGPGVSDALVMRNEFRSMAAAIKADSLVDSMVVTNAADDISGWAFDVSGERTVLALNAVHGSTGGVRLSGESVTAREQVISETKRAIEVSGRNMLVSKNAISVAEVGIHITGGTIQHGANSFDACDEHVVVDDGAEAEEVAVTMEIFAPPSVEVPGEAEPAGSEPALAAEPRIVGDFFPWDGESVSLRTVSRDGKRHVFEVYGGDENLWATLRSNEASLEWDEAASPSDPTRFSVNGPSGVHPYSMRIAQNDKLDRQISGTLLRARWRVDVFEWETDPADDLDAWRAEAEGDRGRRARTTDIALDFGNEGPSELSLSGSVIRAKMRADRFGVIAKSTLPLAPGEYEILVQVGPDDEARLIIDGEVVAHIRTTDQGGTAQARVKVTEPRDYEVELEYVERAGPASLNLEIGLLSGPGGAQD